MHINTQARKYLLALIGFVAVTVCAWLLRDALTLANFTMIYTLLVLVIAIQLGTFAAMTAAFVSFQSINFFLTKPYYTFIVADTRDVIELVVFIIVAVLSGQLGARARLEAQRASERAREQEILYKLTGLMNQAAAKEEVLEALNRVMLEDLGAQQVTVLPDVTAQHTQPQQIENSVLHVMVLRATNKIYGTVSVEFTEEITTQQKHLLSTCVTQAAMALQRIELAEQVQAGQQYEEADRLKTAILRAVSHDLRTPITIIKTSASNLHTLGEKLSDKERAETYQSIENEADHLNKLVGNLLDLSRLQAGTMTLNLELNSLEEVAGDVAARIFQLTGQERVKIDFPGDMPLVRFDYGLILQAMTNLIDNALRYEPPDLQIIIEGHLHKREVWVKIINHGEKIAPDERDRILEPFFHGKDGHIGLGLPIAKSIAEVHRGQLLLEDTPGSGATFILVLPVDDLSEVLNQDEPKNNGRG